MSPLWLRTVKYLRNTLPSKTICAPSICFEHVRISRGGSYVLEDVSATAPAGGSTVLVGPNGAGKTTLLLGMIGELPFQGRILFSDAQRLPRTAYVPQQLALDRGLPLRVDEFLALNRQRRPLWLGLSSWSGPDVLALVRAEHLAHRRMGDLSGGELRRVLLAGALARDPELLVLDEPEAGVDVRGERMFWELLDAARRERGFTQVMVSHNLPLVAHYATHVICINRTVCASGAPRDTLTSSTLMELFGVPIHLYPDQCDPEDPGCPQCGAVSEAEGLLPVYANIRRRAAARRAGRLTGLQLITAATGEPQDDVSGSTGLRDKGGPHA